MGEDRQRHQEETKGLGGLPNAGEMIYLLAKGPFHWTRGPWEDDKKGRKKGEAEHHGGITGKRFTSKIAGSPIARTKTSRNKAQGGGTLTKKQKERSKSMLPS